MKAVIQRVNSAKLFINNALYSEISKGALILVCVTKSDNEESINNFLNYLQQIKLFENSNSQLAESIVSRNYSILLVSQFTLSGRLISNEWDFSDSAKMNDAKKIYEKLVLALNERCQNKIATGIFGEFMNIVSENYGPVTFIYEE